MADPLHAPLPWRLDPLGDGASVLDAAGELVADCGIFLAGRGAARDTANAALIVRAVNNHGALIEAAREMLAAAAGYDQSDMAASRWEATANALEAALATATA